MTCRAFFHGRWALGLHAALLHTAHRRIRGREIVEIVGLHVVCLEIVDIDRCLNDRVHLFLEVVVKLDLAGAVWEVPLYVYPNPAPCIKKMIRVPQFFYWLGV